MTLKDIIKMFRQFEQKIVNSTVTNLEMVWNFQDECSIINLSRKSPE
jgi:hypothetical protein